MDRIRSCFSSIGGHIVGKLSEQFKETVLIGIATLVPGKYLCLELQERNRAVFKLWERERIDRQWATGNSSLIPIWLFAIPLYKNLGGEKKKR